VKRYATLYLATLVVIIPIDFLFLGTIARGFFTSQVGDMLGDVRFAPAILFYLLYVMGILVFVSGPATATWQSTLLYGALFGLFCYATFELTSLSLLKHWTWAGGLSRCVLGNIRHRRVGDHRVDDRQLDRAENLKRIATRLAATDAASRPIVIGSGARGSAAAALTMLRIAGRTLHHVRNTIGITSAAARSGCRASAISSPADRSSWPRRR
jgi:uncharacterized membrane protein